MLIKLISLPRIRTYQTFSRDRLDYTLLCNLEIRKKSEGGGDINITNKERPGYCVDISYQGLHT